jgi:hypothetical protein
MRLNDGMPSSPQPERPARRKGIEIARKHGETAVMTLRLPCKRLQTGEIAMKKLLGIVILLTVITGLDILVLVAALDRDRLARWADTRRCRGQEGLGHLLQQRDCVERAHQLHAGARVRALPDARDQRAAHGYAFRSRDPWSFAPVSVHLLQPPFNLFERSIDGTPLPPAHLGRRQRATLGFGRRSHDQSHDEIDTGRGRAMDVQALGVAGWGIESKLLAT